MLMFLDEADITLKAGRGGDGAISFRRVKYVPEGGPDGGDGGAGGSLYLRADPNLNTLYHFSSQKHFEAKRGQPGGGQDCAGHAGADTTLSVPVGTTVYVAGQKIADLDTPGSTFLVCRGGIGGKGNAGFKSSTRQAPRFAELGEPGEEKIVHLELKLVADVGIIGLPSAGKSTLISVISAAKPKIADYPFTTLVPNLGVVSHRGETFVVTDLPGLIKGAHKGKGLGHQFLRHAERVRFFIHLVDINSPTLVTDYRTIRDELRKYDPLLAEKPEVIVLSKIDLLSEKEVATAIKKLSATVQKRATKDSKAEVAKILAISAPTHAGLTELLDQVILELRGFRESLPLLNTYLSPTPVAPEAITTYRPHLIQKSNDFTLKRKNKEYYIADGPRLNQIAVMTDFHNPEAMNRLHDVLDKFGVVRELVKLGARPGVTVEIADKTFEWIG